MRGSSFLILNGFDRSGSSMVGGMLAKHPQVAYLFQPFSGTEIHKTQFEAWDVDQRAPATEQFFAELLAGRLRRSYIASDWFDRHSTATRPQLGKLNLIKETKLHFKVCWLRARFPKLAILGIWRDPRAIVCSLMRNGFYHRWYGESAFNTVRELVEREDGFAALRPCLDWKLNDPERMAIIVAVRTFYMVENLAPTDWIIYEDVLADPNRALDAVLQRFSLEAFDFAAFLAEDYNVIGRPFESADLWRDYFSDGQQQRLTEICGICGLARPMKTGAHQRASTLR